MEKRPFTGAFGVASSCVLGEHGRENAPLCRTKADERRAMWALERIVPALGFGLERQEKEEAKVEKRRPEMPAAVDG